MIPSILVVAREPVPLVCQLAEAIENMAHIHSTNTAIDGLFIFEKRKPIIIIVDDDLPDLRGESFASIIKDTETGAVTTVYLINVTTLLANAKADHYISAPVNVPLFVEQLKQDLEKLLLLNNRSEEIEKAITLQRGMLPPRINNNAFEIDSLFSPYNDLSGDGMFYLYPKPSAERDALYGFLFDCTGHDLSSYGQASSLWLTLRHGMGFYQKGVYKTLAQVMETINQETLEYYQQSDEPNMSAAIVFMLDFKKRLLKFCPAGNPEIFIKRDKEELRGIKLRSCPLGFDEKIEYKEEQLSLEGIKEIIFASDGLSELLLANQEGEPMEIAKKDDVSAIFIKLK